MPWVNGVWPISSETIGGNVWAETAMQASKRTPSAASRSQFGEVGFG